MGPPSSWAHSSSCLQSLLIIFLKFIGQDQHLFTRPIPCLVLFVISLVISRTRTCVCKWEKLFSSSLVLFFSSLLISLFSLSHVMDFSFVVNKISLYPLSCNIKELHHVRRLCVSLLLSLSPPATSRARE